MDDDGDFDAWEAIADRYRFDDCCDDAFEAVMSVWACFLSDLPIAGDVREAARDLMHGPVASAAADALNGEDPAFLDQVGAFVDVLVDGTSGAVQAGPLVLRAGIAVGQGRPAEAEPDLDRAVRADPAWVLPAGELAELASIRGDAAKAMRLLVAAGLPADDPDVAFLRKFVVAEFDGVGRNEPCPCGSGRKFKQCHQGQLATPPLQRRTGWLIKKVAAQVNQSVGVVGLASSAAAPWTEAPSEQFMERLVGFASDPFITDLATVEGGGLDDFLDTYGSMLPDDERDLAEVWNETPRRLWEVVETEPGESLTLRDTASGDQVVVFDRTGSSVFDEGDYLLAVVVPVGDQHQFLSLAVPVDLRSRERVMELLDRYADADELAEWYGWTLAPPTLQNLEGEALMPRRVRVTPSLEWPAFAAALDEAFEIDEVGGDEDIEGWVDLVEIDGDPLVRGFLMRDGDELFVDCNSAERWERIHAVLRGIDPGITVVDEPAPAPTGPGDPADSPDMQEALRERILAMEARWLDEEIPALGGLTPRQAADDPTRREDLIALLNGFAPIDEPGMMSFDPARLRAALGLTDG